MATSKAQLAEQPSAIMAAPGQQLFAKRCCKLSLGGQIFVWEKKVLPEDSWDPASRERRGWEWDQGNHRSPGGAPDTWRSLGPHFPAHLTPCPHRCSSNNVIAQQPVALTNNHCERSSWSHRRLLKLAEMFSSFPTSVGHADFSTTVLLRYQKSQPSCRGHRDEVASRHAVGYPPSGSRIVGCWTQGSCQEDTQMAGKWLDTHLQPVPFSFTTWVEEEGD